MNTNKQWIMKAALGAVIVVQAVMLIGRSGSEAQASGGGAALGDGWMTTVLHNKDDRLVLMKLEGDNLKMRVYGLSSSERTMRLVSARDTNIDFELKMEMVPGLFKRSRNDTSWAVVKQAHDAYLKQQSKQK